MPSTAPYDFVKLSATQERDLSAQVERHREEALQSRADFPFRHAERYRRFLSDPSLRPPGPWTGSARLFMPTTRSVLERLLDELLQTLFSSLLQIRAVPFGSEDQAGAETATAFLRWSLTQTLDWYTTAYDLLFDALMDSVGVAKVTAWEAPWQAPSQDIRRFLRRSVRIDALDLGMLLVAPDAEGLQYPECRFVAQEFFLTEDDLLRMERRGFDTPQADELGSSQDLTDRKQVELEREGERIVEFRPDTIAFCESYERFTLDRDIGDEDLIVSWFPETPSQGTSDSVANRGWIAGVRRLVEVFPQDDRPRRPFFPITCWRQPRQWRGMNVPDRLESMQDLINRLHEQLVNYGEVSMLPFVFVNTYLTGEIPDLRTVQPGATVPIDDISGVQFAPTRSLNRHFAEQIQMMQANVERDTRVTDFNLGRQGQASNAPRTASATMALLAETRKSYSGLVHLAARQFTALLSFDFRLWQEIVPDDTFVPVASMTNPGQVRTLWDRLFNPRSLTATGEIIGDVPPAVPISKEHISGLYDIAIDVNPNEQFDRQVALALFQLTAPALGNYPLGLRLMLKRMWTIFGQQGFDDVYPEEVALLQTQQHLMAVQVQVATFEAQLAQIDQAQAQQQIQGLQQAGQEAAQMSPELAAAAQALQNANGATP